MVNWGWDSGAGGALKGEEGRKGRNKRKKDGRRRFGGFGRRGRLSGESVSSLIPAYCLPLTITFFHAK